MQTPPPESDHPVPRPFRFLAMFAGCVLLLLAGNLVLSGLNIGRFTRESAASCQNIRQRIALGRAMAHPKLVMIGGSSVRRGFSMTMIADRFQVSTLNFGLRAAMGPSLILSEARKVLKPGDTAILSLEYSQYAVDRWNPVSLDMLFGCETDYLGQLSPAQKFGALMAVSPTRILSVIRFMRGRRSSANALEVAGQSYPAVTRAQAHGDIPLAAEFFPALSQKTHNRVAAYRPIPVTFLRRAQGTAAIADFVRWARAHDIKVAMTWPNTIAFPEYRTMSGFDDIRNFYRGLGVPIIGEPELGEYPAALFYDTQYHLQLEGIRRRTDDFIAVMRRQGDLLPAGTAGPDGH